jgi:hypothetical protein
MGVCRLCGAECAPDDLLAVHEGGGCVNCNGSPSCTRCGHARRDHRGTFGAGDPGCKVQLTPEVGLARARCGCRGYTTDAAALWEAVPLVDVTELRLRAPGEPELDDGLELAPIRDLFDEQHGFGDDAELGGVPWRPPN